MEREKRISVCRVAPARTLETAFLFPLIVITNSKLHQRFTDKKNVHQVQRIKQAPSTVQPLKGRTRNSTQNLPTFPYLMLFSKAKISIPHPVKIYIHYFI